MKKALSRAVLLLVAGGLLLFLLVPRPPLRDGLSFSHAVYDSDGRLLRLTLSADDKYRLWLPLDDIAPVMAEATMLQEDRFFRWHPGVNPVSLVRAVWETYIKKGRRMGASTITMQLARIRYDISSRTPGGKLWQILKAIQLELHYSKDEILEAYLNLVPYGHNIEGIGAASLVYFDRRASSLTLEDSLLLSVVPQNPGERVPTRLERDGMQHSPLAVARTALFERWAERHPEDVNRRELMELPVEVRHPGNMPFLAPHLCDSVLMSEKQHLEIFTTLDIKLQRLLERLATGYVERNRDRGIRNASALLLDYRTMEIRALLGSVDFFDRSIQGQVNGTDALRSPGSTIKPFVYALGIDRGLIHPMTMIKDSPTSFGAYSPENFDHRFAGPVKVKDALIRSRNIPALEMAMELEPDGVYEFLKNAGIPHLREKGFYGLSVAMGGAEVTMEELVELYAMLANGGMMRPARRLVDGPQEEGVRLLSPEASFITMEMLGENPRARATYPRQWTSDDVTVYWKTGTSFSFRDAWSVGVFGPYVLAVWIGNFDGQGNPAFVGRRAAGPLFFQIVDALRSEGLQQVYNRRDLNIKDVDVCAVSGGLPNSHCPRTVKTLFIPGVSPIKKCDIHREVVIDNKTGLRACGKQGRDIRTEVYEFWPSDLLKIFRMAGIPRRTPPPYEPGCADTTMSAQGAPPKIISPLRNVEYSLRVNREQHSRVPLTAVADADSPRVYWFVDESFVGSSGSRETFYWEARPGTFMVRVVDERGRSDAREVVVTMVQ